MVTGMDADDLAALLTFYRDRLDEDEAVARRNIGAEPGRQNGLGDVEGAVAPLGWPDYQTFDGEDLAAANDYINRFRPLRELREIAAKRAFLAWYTDAVDVAALLGEKLGSGSHMATAAESYLNAIKANATAWNDHPEYRAAWAPPAYPEQAT